jgi:hypothetical protein
MSQPLRLPYTPNWKESGMNHDEIPLSMEQGEVAHPIEQIVSVRRIENRRHRVPRLGNTKTFGKRQEVEIVVAQHRNESVAESFGPTQHRKGVGTSIHQVADQPQPIMFVVETDLLEQVC